MHSAVIDWNHIRAGLEDELLGDRYGWIDRIELGLLRLKAEIADLDSLPRIVQIQQKFGELRFYADGSVAPNIQQALDQVSQQCANTCEVCGNAARRQKVGFYIAVLCCHCFNKIKKEQFDAEGDQDDFLELDLAEQFPDLIHPDCANPKPVIGSGWVYLLEHRLRQMESATVAAGLEPGTVQISDIKRKLGNIQIDFHRYHPVVKEAERAIELDTQQTCIKCGHIGGRNRGRREFACLCDYCLFEKLFA